MIRLITPIEPSLLHPFVTILLPMELAVLYLHTGSIVVQQRDSLENTYLIEVTRPDLFWLILLTSSH